jgi:hypothetical protein
MPAPVHQVQLLPGTLEIPGDRLPAGLVLVRWDIHIPDRQRSANVGAVITARQDIPGVGFLDMGRWTLLPSYPMEGIKAAPLALIQIPPGGDLLVRSDGYQHSILSFFLHPFASNLIAGNSVTMGIQQPPFIPPSGNGSTISVVTANAANATAVAANATRLVGLIENRANRTLWVKFGDPAAAPLLTASGNFSQVPANGNIDIPENFTGPIGLIWAAGVSTSGNALITEIIP